MHEKKKLEEAKYFYSKMIEEQENRKNFEYNLSALLSSTRSILQYALCEAKEKPMGEHWYNTCISSIHILEFFKEKRDINIHEEPIQPIAHSKIGLADTIFPSGSICKWQVEMHLARKTILHLLERKKWFNPPLLFEF